MRVKIFYEGMYDKLELAINSFLEKNEEIQVKDIQYTHFVAGEVGEWHNALILYE